jgi:hypothetical protein
MKKKNMFHTLASMLMAAVFILGSMTSVQASSYSKEVTLSDSGVTYVDYDEYAEMVLSSDGKTLIFNYSGYKNGEAVSSYNLKKYIPSKILKKFEDGEVYLYEKEVYDWVFEDSTDKAAQEELASVKKEGFSKWQVQDNHGTP